jgi:hypothetical protein
MLGEDPFSPITGVLTMSYKMSSMILNRTFEKGVFEMQSNYIVILKIKLSTLGKIGELHVHIFSDVEHFDSWFDKEARDKYSLHLPNATVEQSCKFSNS